MRFRVRRIVVVLAVLITFGYGVYQALLASSAPSVTTYSITQAQQQSALDTLAHVAVKGRAPKTGYSRDQFGHGWSVNDGCDTRDTILNRDLRQPVVNGECQVTEGTLDDPYTGKVIHFVRGSQTSSAVQIDHVVALGDAWQKGAQLLTAAQREALANDPLELLAVDGQANQQKSDGDAATWLPPNKSFRCQYVARQIAIKKKYDLWVTQAEHDTMADILHSCQTRSD